MSTIDLGSTSTIWRWVQDPANWLEVSPTSTISDVVDLSPTEGDVRVVVDAFANDGYAVANVIPLSDALAARNCVAAVRDAGIPAVFAYVYDELWLPLRPLLGHITEAIGPCAALDDGWAWQIMPGVGRGWSGHRGSSDEGRNNEVPRVVNVWLALSDVTSRHSTMVVVPRRLDPHFPRSLDEAPDEHLGVPLSARVGDAIYWDARVYHWGSESHADAVGPRISCSYTIASDAFDPTARRIGPILPGLDHRLQLIARWIRTYRHLDATITPPISDWADRWAAAGEAFHGR